MNVLVIGGTGFIGAPTVRRLAEAGHAVTVIHRGGSTADLPAGVGRVIGDRNALFELRATLERLAPDVVLDLVPYTEKQALEVARTFTGMAGRLVAVSSGDVYRNYDGLRRRSTLPPDPVPLAETAPLREELFPYRGSDIPFEDRDDYEKILVERVVMGQAGLPGTILRLPAVYGPGNRQHRLGTYVRRMDDGRPAILLGEGEAGWRWTRGYVENVAAAVALAVTHAGAAGRIFNVGDEPTLTVREWVMLVADSAGWRGEIVEVPDERLPNSLRQPYDWRYHLETDTGLIRQALGYREPVPPKQAIAATIEWERANRGPEDAPDYAEEDAAIAQNR